MPAQPVNDIVVIKMNPAREEVWRYSGRVLKRANDGILLEAFFNRPDRPFHGIVMCQGDRFVEKYFFGRWYNIYEIHDRDDDRIKGWYCNVTEPAEMIEGQITYVDLALDLLVYPDGKMLVLDEDEFEASGLPDIIRRNALVALEELKSQFSQGAAFILN
jgi:hypothetical protein